MKLTCICLYFSCFVLCSLVTRICCDSCFVVPMHSPQPWDVQCSQKCFFFFAAIREIQVWQSIWQPAASEQHAWWRQSQACEMPLLFSVSVIVILCYSVIHIYLDRIVTPQHHLPPHYSLLTYHCYSLFMLSLFLVSVIVTYYWCHNYSLLM